MPQNSPSIPVATIVDGGLAFAADDGLHHALKHGLFYLRYPDSYDFTAGERFAKSYFLDDDPDQPDPYRGYRQRDIPATRLGYSDPSKDQVELFQLELGLWSEWLPADLASQLHGMNRLAKLSLNWFFDQLGVPADDRGIIIDGYLADQGLQYCIFNHFRRKRHGVHGFTAHKDSGFITLLHTTEGGLETFEHGQWHPIDPLPGHFTVVLGHAFEVLMARSVPALHASYHRVREGTGNRPDRFSFGVYIGPRFEQDLWQYDDARLLTKYMSFMDFQKEKAREMAFEFHPLVADDRLAAAQ